MVEVVVRGGRVLVDGDLVARDLAANDGVLAPASAVGAGEGLVVGGVVGEAVPETVTVAVSDIESPSRMAITWYVPACEGAV